MVSKAQIDKLSARIERLAPRADETWGVAVIFVRNGETKAEAEERHYHHHPEDRAKRHMVIVSFVAAKNGEPAQSCVVGREA